MEIEFLRSVGSSTELDEREANKKNCGFHKMENKWLYRKMSGMLQQGS
jgi:hypothetical protein